MQLFSSIIEPHLDASSDGILGRRFVFSGRYVREPVPLERLTGHRKVPRTSTHTMNNKTSIISIIALSIALLAIALTFVPRTVAPTSGFGGFSAATFAEPNSTSTLVSVATGTQTIVIAGDAHRTSLQICNQGTAPTTLSYNSGTAYGVGIILNPQASSTNNCRDWEFPSVPIGNIYGMASTTTGSVGVLRGDAN